MSKKNKNIIYIGFFTVPHPHIDLWLCLKDEKAAALVVTGTKAASSPTSNVSVTGLSLSLNLNFPQTMDWE